MYLRDAAGITTTERVSPPPPGPWDDCFTDLRRPPVLRWPGFLELTIESDCPAWVVYTEPEDALCVEPQTAPPDALNTGPTVVEPGRPLIAEMTWRWRSLALSDRQPAAEVIAVDDGQRPGQLRIGQLGDLGGGHLRHVVRIERGDVAGALDDDVGGDPVVPDLAAIRGQPLDGPDPQRRPVRQRELAEDRPGPERRDADDLAAAGVLDRAGHDLRRAGRAGVDEDDERQVGGEPARRDGGRGLVAVGRLLDVDVAVLEELAGDGRRPR